MPQVVATLNIDLDGLWWEKENNEAVEVLGRERRIRWEEKVV